jgi:hypothetical protein
MAVEYTNLARSFFLMTLTRRSQRGKDGLREIEEKPAPWTLRIDNSWILPFHSTSKIPEYSLQNEESREDQDGLGMAMVVSYKDSNAGPYDELLFAIPCSKPSIPGEIFPTYHIPVIYVSTEESVRNGRRNWGIRKELADFSWKHSTGFLYRKTSLIVNDRLTGYAFLPFLTDSC